MLRVNDNRRLVIACTIAAAACALRFIGLEHQSLWNDEMFSLDVALSPLGEIQQKLVSFYHHPPLFFYLAHAALKLFGMSAWALRSTSALAGGLTAGLVFLASSTPGRVRGGLVAGLLCALAPFHLAYSQEGRPYALAAFLCLASFYSLYLLVPEKKRLWMSLYVLSAVALLYTHHWGVFALGAQAILFFFWGKTPWQEKKRFGIILGIISLLYLPEFFALRSQMAATHPSDWFWVEGPGLAQLGRLAAAYSGTYFQLASARFSLPVIWQILSVIAAGVTLVAALFTTGTAARAPLAALAALLAIPFAVSFLKPEVFLWYRYTLIGFPLFCVAVGAATGRGTWRWPATAAAALLLAVAVSGTLRYFSWSKANAKDVAAYVDTVTREQPRILIRPRAFAPLLNYYYKGNALQYDEAYLNEPLGGIVDTAASFVYISLDVPNGIRDYMDSHFHKVSERCFPGEAHMGVIVGVYAQKPEEE
jgi:4-amino-4-deoxy-L-arabinose transferase-like glycosyltransferase